MLNFSPGVKFYFQRLICKIWNVGTLMRSIMAFVKYMYCTYTVSCYTVCFTSCILLILHVHVGTGQYFSHSSLITCTLAVYITQWTCTVPITYMYFTYMYMYIVHSIVHVQCSCRASSLQVSHFPQLFYPAFFPSRDCFVHWSDAFLLTTMTSH